MAPHTEVGKLTLIAYALFGIPLMFLMLQGFGQHLTVLSSKVNKLKLCSKRPAVNKYLNMVLIILLGVSFLFAGPTVLFMYVEGWTLMEGLYYCFVTLSTIGFGDYITGNYWASTRDFGTYAKASFKIMGLVATKPVFGVSDKASFKPVSLATRD